MTTNQNPGLFGRLLGGLFGRGKAKSSTEQALDRATSAPGDLVPGPEPRDSEAAIAQAAETQEQSAAGQALAGAPEPVAPIKTVASSADPKPSVPKPTRARATATKKPAAKPANSSSTTKKASGSGAAKTSSAKPRKPSAPKP